MGYADVLKSLCPVKLGPVHAGDCAVEGAAFDECSANIDALMLELFPDTASLSLPDWERVYALLFPPPSTAARRNAILAAMNATGGLSAAYFIRLAANLGYTITVTPGGDIPLFKCDHSKCGDILGGSSLTFYWFIDGVGVGLPIYFKCDISRCGDVLLYQDPNPLQILFERLKPAHSVIVWRS